MPIALAASNLEVMTTTPVDPMMALQEALAGRYVLQGELEFTSGQQRIVMRAGDSIYFYSKTPHSLRGVGTVPPRVVAVLYPYSG